MPRQLTKTGPAGVPQIFQGYCDRKLPYLGHLTLMATFLGGFGAAFTALASRKRKSPEPAWADLILLAIATHKISRIATKDRVTSSFRAPFARLTGDSGSGEVEETARGEGLQRAIGELLTCPFCAAPWIASTLVLLYETNPSLARMVATVFSVVSGSDFLNRVYYGAKQIGEPEKTDRRT